MRTSESITALADALSKAQAEMTGAKKDSANPFFKSSYADLASVMEAISKPFANHGLSFMQSPGFDEGLICVTTRIMHSSGEWSEGDCILPPTKNDAQGYGSAISYAKRYGLQAMTGCPSVDDDGNDAVKHATDKPAKTTKKKAAKKTQEPVHIDVDKVFYEGVNAAEQSIGMLETWWKGISADERKVLGPDNLAKLKAMCPEAS